MTPEIRAVGARLRELRKAKRLTVERVAARTGISFSSICDAEHGSGKRGPTVDTIARLASVYGVSLAKVFEVFK